MYKNILLACIAFLSFSARMKAGDAGGMGVLGGKNGDLFGTRTRFIENVGQYGNVLDRHQGLGQIQFAYEGLNMPVLFTSSGIAFLQRKVEALDHEARERLEAKGITEEELSLMTSVTERVITMEWIGGDPFARFHYELQAEGYHTYGTPRPARGFQRVTCGDVWPGIDVVFTLDPQGRAGFEYSFVIHPGADPASIALRFGGDVDKVRVNSDDQLVLRTDIDGITQSLPVGFYGDERTRGEVPFAWDVLGHEARIRPLVEPDRGRTLVIDPFVTSTTNLTGIDANKAIDVDFDYAGNVFIKGGGDGNVRKLAKYDANGVLQWTFAGTLAVPAWSFGSYGGGWVVEKNSGKVYLGQGFNPATGHIVVRLDAAGLYDNYSTTADPNFRENWKMMWICNNGAPQIIIAGGGTNSNINLGVCTPPATALSSVNLTNIPYSLATGWAQDICDLIIDPINADLYTIYGSLIGTPSLTNRIYKNSAPYNAGTVAWNIASGFTTVQEIANRPYLSAGLIDNACNVLAVNSSYFFYYDGRNLSAFNKLTGAAAGTALNLGTTALMQGGIVVDECNNVFVGGVNGTVKTYTFNGSVFNDAALPDIAIPGFATNSVYDLVLNDAQKLIYACGNGFVAALDIAGYGCASTTYSLSVSTDCVNLSATSTLSPVPPGGSTVTYLLYSGNTQMASNGTGVFTGLQPNTTYSVHAIVNQTCSGVQTIASFTLPSPNLSVTFSNTTCGNSTGAISALGSAGAPPLTYSIDGVNFQASGAFGNLPAGVYTVQVRDNNGCRNSSTVQIINSNGPTPTLTKTDAACGGTNGTITASAAGGTAPYQYALDGGAYQVATTFTNVPPGPHVVTVKDVTNCTNAASITVNSIGGTTVTATTTAAHCGNATGSITGIVTGGSAPYVYALDGGAYGTNEVFTGVTGGAHTLSVKDANSCINNIPVAVTNVPGPSFTATASPTSCNALTGTVTVVASGGTAPLQFSVNNGSSYQPSNLFTSLNAGTYQVVVRDASLCTSTGTVVVNLSIPQVTDSTTASACNTPTGTITAIGTGGILPYQYALNGGTFQTANVFSGLSSGTYTLTIRDAALCTNSISPVTVGNTSGLTINAIATNTSCTANTGAIVAAAGGGVAPLQYSLDGVTWQAGNVFGGLSAGQRTVRVRDANLCISTVVVTVNTIAGPSVTATATSTSCNNPIGTVTAMGSGGTPPYQFSIGGPFQGSGLFTGLTPGPKTITVRDANLCTGTVSVTVTNNGGSSGPSITATVVTANCNQSDGQIHATGSGGQNPLKYSLDGVNFSGGANFNNLPPGTYTVWIKDANNCLNSVTVTIPNFPGPQVSAVVTPSLCGASTGTIVATGSGGTAPYRYSIDNGVNFQTSNTFSGLQGGLYTLTVRDNANICRNSIIVYIPNSNGPSPAPTKVDATCGVNNGSITATASGGVPPLSYSIDGVNFQSGSLFPSLSPGPYVVTVKDATGCSNSTSLTVGSTALPTFTANLTPEACAGTNGSIAVTGSAGSAPYQYALNGGAFQPGSSFNGLAAGTYTVTLKDATQCQVTEAVSINSVTGPTLVVNTIAAVCGENNGYIIITGTSGTLPYQFSLDGTTWQSSFVFSGLAAGSYTARIKDANGCTSLTACTVGTTIGSTLTWTGAVSTNWHDAGNWGGCVVPSCKYNVVIPGGPANQPVISAQNASARTVHITPAASLSVTASRQLMVCDDFTNNGSFSAGNGTTVLVQDTCLLCTGGIVHDQILSGNLTGANRFWHLTITKPLTTQVMAANNMDIAGDFTTTSTTSDFNSNGKYIKLGGNFNNSNGAVTYMGSAPNGTLEFNGAGAQNYLAGGSLGLNNVRINNSGTGVTLVGSDMLIGTGGTLDLALGLVITNAQVAYLKNNAPASLIGGSASSYVQGNLRRNLNGLPGSFDFPVGHVLMGYQKANITFSTNTTIPDLLANFHPYPLLPVGPVASDCAGYDYSLLPVLDNGYWNINASANPTSGTYDATLYNANFTPIAAYPTVVRSSVSPPVSASWTLSGTCDVASTAPATRRTAMNGFSAFGTGLGAGSTLPVELLYFTGRALGARNLLEWSTASERNSSAFILERSADGVDFDAFFQVPAAGNSTEELHYEAIDGSPQRGITYYRLRQVDLDGAWALSQVVAIARNTHEQALLLYPNPTRGIFTIGPTDPGGSLSVFDPLGRAVLSTVGSLKAITLDLSGYADGVYVVETVSAEGIPARAQLVKD